MFSLRPDSTSNTTQCESSLCSETNSAQTIASQFNRSKYRASSCLTRVLAWSTAWSRDMYARASPSLVKSNFSSYFSSPSAMTTYYMADVVSWINGHGAEGPICPRGRRTATSRGDTGENNSSSRKRGSSPAARCGLSPGRRGDLRLFQLPSDRR